MNRHFTLKQRSRSVLRLLLLHVMISLIASGVSTARDSSGMATDKKIMVNPVEASSKQGLQEISVTGTVMDQATRQPIPGVNVIQKGTTNGTTDSRPEFNQWVK